jgi:hypothetical protein
MAKVTLKNTSRSQTFIATYYHEIVGRRSNDKLYTVERRRSANGKVVAMKQPHSFSILPGQEAEVHEVALHLPQVRAACKKGWLEKRKAKAETASTKAAAPAAPAAPAAQPDASAEKSAPHKKPGRGR